MSTICDVVTWIQENGDPLKDGWLILGKGPSFARYLELDLKPYHLFAIGDTCRFIWTDLVHFSDYEAFRRSADALRIQAGLDHHCAAKVVMPWHPHVKHKPHQRSLEDWLAHDSELYRLHAQGRLLSYNSTVAHKMLANPDLATVRVRFFSAVAVLNILAQAGIKVVRTLGIDGGREYAGCFDKAPLGANGRASFDVQFGEIQRTIRRHQLSCRPLVEGQGEGR